MPSTAQASNTAGKTDDASPFAMMLAAVAPQPKTGADKQAQDDSDTQTAQDDARFAQTVDAGAPQIAAAPIPIQTPMQSPPAKPAKDSKTDDAADNTVPPPVATMVDPSVLPTVAMAVPQQPLAMATPVNDSADDAAVTAATPSTSPAPASSPATPAAGTQPAVADTDTDTDPTPDQAGAPGKTAAQQTPAPQPSVQPPAPQTVAQQPVPQQPLPDVQSAAPQPKPVAKTVKAADTTDGAKAGARKTATADAGDGVKPAANAPSSNAAAPAPVIKDAAQPPASAPQSAPSPELTVTGIAAPQASAQTGITPTAPAQHIEITAQPHPNLPALAVQIAAKSQSGARQFDIRLDPPELGHVDVRLSIDATGKASAHLSADQPQTLDLLQKDAPALTRALREAGLDVSQDGLNFSLRQQNQDNGQSGSAFADGRGRISLAANLTTEATATTSAYRAPLDGRLDIRV